MDAVTELPGWRVRRLGLCRYRESWQAMQAFTDARRADTEDELWLLQHPPVFTLGQAGRWEHVLAPGDIEVVPVDRGGQVTYHGPGQIVAYPLVDLRRLGIGVRELVCRIEQAIIDCLAEYQVNAERRQGAPGVYVGERKIAALGLRVRRGCSFHGLAFNIDMNLEPFARINPCGFQGLQVCQLIDLQPAVGLPEVEQQLIAKLSAQLGLRPIDSEARLPVFVSASTPE